MGLDNFATGHQRNLNEVQSHVMQELDFPGFARHQIVLKCNSIGGSRPMAAMRGSQTKAPDFSG